MGILEEASSFWHCFELIKVDEVTFSNFGCEKDASTGFL